MVRPGSRHVRMSRLMHIAVHNRHGVLLGRVEELLLEPADGRVEYALLELQGGAGPTRRLVAVPWTALRRSTDRDHFVLDASPATLRAIRAYY